MTTRTKPEVRLRVGDLAFVPAAATFGSPFFRIDSVELSAAGEVTGYFLSAPGSSQSAYVEAARVSAVVANILTQSRE